MSIGIRTKKSQLKTQIYCNDQLPYNMENTFTIYDTYRQKHKKQKSHSHLESLSGERYQSTNQSFADLFYRNRPENLNGSILSILTKNKNLPVVKKLRSKAFSALNPGSFLSRQTVRDHNKTPRNKPMVVFKKKSDRRLSKNNVRSIGSPERSLMYSKELEGKTVKFRPNPVSKHNLLPLLGSTEKINDHNRIGFKLD